MANEPSQVIRRFETMLWKRMFLLLCVASIVSASYSFGGEDDVDVTGKYIAEHKDQFRVETSVCEGSVKFTFTQFVHEPRYWLGNLKIRKAGRTLVDCRLLPTKDKSHVSFSFTVSKDVISESEFVLYETGLMQVFEQDGKPVVLQREMPQVGGTNYHFRLTDFFGSTRHHNKSDSS